MHHFLILFVIVKWNDRNTIIYLEGKTVHTVIDDDNILQIPAIKDSQVFDIVTFFSKKTVLSVQSMT